MLITQGDFQNGPHDRAAIAQASIRLVYWKKGEEKSKGKGDALHGGGSFLDWSVLSITFSKWSWTVHEHRHSGRYPVSR